MLVPRGTTTDEAKAEPLPLSAYESHLKEQITPEAQRIALAEWAGYNRGTK
jgi:hypothetical protein